MLDQRVTFTLSDLGAPLMPATALHKVVRECGLAGLDIDITRHHRLSVSRLRSLSGSALPIASWWMRAADKTTLKDEMASIRGASDDCSRTTIILDSNNVSLDQAVSPLIRRAVELRQDSRQPVKMSIGVRPHRTAVTPHHLASLQSLRMQAEEWELGLALDLGNEIDWLWEAEAAVACLMPALNLIRIRVQPRSFDGRFREAQAVRAISAAFDLGFAGQIALITPVPVWYWRNQTALQAACSDALLLFGAHQTSTLNWDIAQRVKSPPYTKAN